MKKILLLLFLIPMAIMAQVLPQDSITGKINFKKITELDSSYSSEIIYNAAKEWFVTNTKKFNISNSEKNLGTSQFLFGIKNGNSATVDALYKNDQPLKMQDPVDKKLIGKCMLKYTGTTFGCTRIMYVECDVKISIKASKIKSEITNFNYIHYNQVSMQQVQLAGWNDKGPCKSKAEMEDLFKCIECRDLLDLFSYVKNEILLLENDLLMFVKNNKGSSDDW